MNTKFLEFTHFLVHYRISFEYVRERADLATDIYLTFRSMNKSPSYSLEKAFVVLFRDFDTKDFNPFE